MRARDSWDQLQRERGDASGGEIARGIRYSEWIGCADDDLPRSQQRQIGAALIAGGACRANLKDDGGGGKDIAAACADLRAFFVVGRIRETSLQPCTLDRKSVV